MAQAGLQVAVRQAAELQAQRRRHGDGGQVLLDVVLVGAEVLGNQSVKQAEPFGAQVALRA
jgi:hypothetical protein